MWHVSADYTEMQCFNVLESQEVNSKIRDEEGGRGYKVDLKESLLVEAEKFLQWMQAYRENEIFVARTEMLLTVIIWNIIFSQVITLIDILQKAPVRMSVVEAHPQQNLWRQSTKVCWALCSMLNEVSLVHAEIMV